jgi:RimJ/RimL family protein N-acetyltransferase
MTVWKAKQEGLPGRVVLAGASVRLVPLTWPEPGRRLAEVMAAQDSALWRYMKFGPFESAADFQATFEVLARDGRQPMMIESPDGEALGTASFLRVRPNDGSAELGSIAYGQKMQKSRAGTEAMFLMMQHLFDDLGWRRCEWQCNDRNARSYRAAERLGFTYEGTFRQDHVVKGQNRDSAWFSVLDSEWPPIKKALTAYLAPENFEGGGRQKRRLADFMPRRGLSSLRG